MKAPPSTTPAPGDGVVGCAHKPDPHASHVFWSDEPIGFRRPDGSTGTARWIMICARCFVRYRGDASQVPIGCDLVWPDDEPPIVYHSDSKA